MDVAVRPTGQRWVVSYDETWVEELVSQMVDLGPPWRCWRPRAGWNCRWWPHWPLRRCRWWWSTRVKFETSPGQPGRWPRPTLWTRQSWLTSPTPSLRAPSQRRRNPGPQLPGCPRRQVMTMLVSELASTPPPSPSAPASSPYCLGSDLDRRGAQASFRSLVAQGRRRAIAGPILLKDGIADVVGWL